MYALTLHLNARLRPLDRGDIYEDPIGAALEKNGCGYVSGGGTMQDVNGEIMSCDIEICLNNKSTDILRRLQNAIQRIGAPKGSFLRGDDLDIPVGTLEGLALYLNGKDLPDEVYKSCDVNDLIEKLDLLLDGLGHMYSYWYGPDDTALYFYGTSFDEMKERMGEFLTEYPLCQKCKVKRIS